MRRRRPISERLALHGLDPRVTSILRVGGGSGGGGGGGGGDGPSPTISHLIYVMKGGNDSTGDGTDEQPYLTVGRALAVAKTFVGLSQAAMVLVLVGPGMYVENVAIPPFVIVSAMDESGADVLIGAGSGPAITLDSVAWATSTSGYAGVVNILTNYLVGDLSGPINIDFTGVTSPGSFLVAGIGVAGSLTVTGDSVGGGFVFVTSEAFIDEDITLTGVIMSMLGGSALFGTLTFASSATQASGGFVSDCSVISEFSAGSVVLDATAGQNVAVIVDATNVDGSLTLKDGGGGVTNYTASVGGIPGQIIRTGGAAAPKLTRYASTQLPDSTFMIYVNKSGDDTNGNGTEGAPFLTIGQAMTVAATLGPTLDQNALVIAGPGFYTENVVLPPFVFLTSLDAGEQSTNVNGTLTLSAGWAASTGISVGGVAGMVIIDDATLDLTGTPDGNLYFTNAYMAGNVTFTGDPTNGGFCAIRLSEVAGDLSVTAMDLESHEMTFDGNVNVTSTAAQPASWTSIQDGSFFNGVVVTGDSTAGNSVTFLMTGTQYPFGTLVLNGVNTTYRSSIGAPASYTLLNGAAAPVTEPTGFVPTVPSDWSTVPISIQGALDELAASGGGQPLSMLYVAPGGSDVTGNGSFAKPYQTIAEAITVATPLANVNEPYVILIAEGTYAEAPVLPAFVSLQGLNSATPNITGNVTVNPTFAASGKTSVSNVNLSGGMTAAFGTVATPALAVKNSTVNGLTTTGTGGYTLTQQNNQFIGDVSISDPTTVISASNTFQGALSVSATNQAVTFQSNQDTALGAVNMTGVTNPLASTMTGTAVKGGTLTLNGAQVTYTATSGAIPSTVVLSGGATSPGSASFGTVVQTGTATLVNGVSPAIPAPAVMTGLSASKITFTLALVNLSTVLGVPRVSTITAGTSFVVTSYMSGTPGSIETGDQSTYDYIITNPSAP